VAWCCWVVSMGVVHGCTTMCGSFGKTCGHTRVAEHGSIVTHSNTVGGVRVSTIGLS